MTDKEAAGEADVAVIGTALAGLAAALALAESGARVGLAGPRLAQPAMRRDTRSTALFGPSLTLLRRLGAWREMEGCSQPLVGLRLIDDTDAWIRAPEVLFEAREIGAEMFGVNFENWGLMEALVAAVDQHPLIRWHEGMATGFCCDAERASVEVDGRAGITCRLIVGADGAGSATRKAAGISAETWSYPQVAIASRFGHERPHGGISTELHRRAGPMTTVPLPGNNSSLVWVETPAEAERLMRLDDEGFRGELERRLGAVLGTIGAVGGRAAFPIAGVSAREMGRSRIALVGEAAHRLPPIGAQGLNLGLRDIAWLAELVGDALAAGGDPGSEALLAEYGRLRRGDMASRTLVVDTLNRSLYTGALPLDLARGAGLAALKAIGPLRHLFMREGMAPAGPLPRLMQAGA